MMRSLLRPLPVLLLLVILGTFTGCPGGSTSGDPNLSVAPVTGEAVGSLSGHVIVVNADQQRLSDKSGIEVRVEGFPRSSITNASGFWSFSNLPEGNLTISWTKPGFGMTRMVAYRFPGGDVRSIKVWVVEQPHFSVARLQGSSVNGSVLLEGETQGSTGMSAYAVRVFVGTNQHVSADPKTYLCTFCVSFAEGVPPESAQENARSNLPSGSRFSFQLDRAFLEAAGFRTGSPMYIVAYADGIPSVSYLDPVTAREVFTTINPEPSPVCSVVLL